MLQAIPKSGKFRNCDDSNGHKFAHKALLCWNLAYWNKKDGTGMRKKYNDLTKKTCKSMACNAIQLLVNKTRSSIKQWWRHAKFANQVMQQADVIEKINTW